MISIILRFFQSIYDAIDQVVFTFKVHPFAIDYALLGVITIGMVIGYRMGALSMLFWLGGYKLSSFLYERYGEELKAMAMKVLGDQVWASWFAVLFVYGAISFFLFLTYTFVQFISRLFVVSFLNKLIGFLVGGGLMAMSAGFFLVAMVEQGNIVVPKENKQAMLLQEGMIVTVKGKKEFVDVNLFKGFFYRWVGKTSYYVYALGVWAKGKIKEEKKEPSSQAKQPDLSSLSSDVLPTQQTPEQHQNPSKKEGNNGDHENQSSNHELDKTKKHTDNDSSSSEEDEQVSPPKSSKETKEDKNKVPPFPEEKKIVPHSSKDSSPTPPGKQPDTKSSDPNTSLADTDDTQREAGSSLDQSKELNKQENGDLNHSEE